MMMIAIALALALFVGLVLVLLRETRLVFDLVLFLVALFLLFT